MKVDIDYSLTLLKKINRLKISDVPISQVYEVEGYSLWVAKELYLLSRLKEYSKYRNYKAYCDARQEYTAEPSGGVVRKMFTSVFLVTVSVLALFRMCIIRPRFLLYEADRLYRDTSYGERLYTVMQTLTEEGEPFMEFIHIVPEVNPVGTFFRRKRLVFYIEVIDMMYSFFMRARILTNAGRYIKSASYEEFTDDEREMVQSILPGFLYNLALAQFRRKILTRIFKVHTWVRRPEYTRYVSIDDVRFLDEFLHICQKNTIMTCVYQHSNFDWMLGLDEEPSEEYIFPDRFYMWNEYWKETIVRKSPLFRAYADHLCIGGRAYNFNHVTQQSRSVARTDSCTMVLVPYEASLGADDVRLYMAGVLAHQENRILFVLRGDLDRRLQVEKYFTEEYLKTGRVEIIEPHEKEKAIVRADLVMGAYSGFLDEMVELGIPVLQVVTSYQSFNSLAGAGLAASLQSVHPEEISRQIAAAKATPLDERKRRSVTLTKGTGDARDITRGLIREVRGT